MMHNSTDNLTNIGQDAVPSKQGSHQLAQAASLTEPKSCITNLQFSPNSLINGAAPVILAITTLGNTSVLDDTRLFNSLVHETKTFERKARKLDYRSPIVLAARYLLCCYVDEMLAENKSTRALWKEKSLLQTLQGENYGGERFFTILERASEEAKLHLDLLELGFLLLSLGYKGKYLDPSRPHTELENIKDNLYALIKKHRGDLTPTLYLTEKLKETVLKKSNKRKTPHLYFAIGILIAGVVSVYLPYHITLSKKAELITKQVNANKESFAALFRGEK